MYLLRLPRELRANIYSRLPIDDLDHLQSMPEGLLLDDTIDAIAVHEVDAPLALRLKNPHLKQLVRKRRDAVASDARAYAQSHNALAQHETFDAACKDLRASEHRDDLWMLLHDDASTLPEHAQQHAFESLAHDASEEQWSKLYDCAKAFSPDDTALAKNSRTQLLRADGMQEDPEFWTAMLARATSPQERVAYLRYLRSYPRRRIVAEADVNDFFIEKAETEAERVAILEEHLTPYQLCVLTGKIETDNEISYILVQPAWHNVSHMLGSVLVDKAISDITLLMLLQHDAFFPHGAITRRIAAKKLSDVVRLKVLDQNHLGDTAGEDVLKALAKNADSLLARLQVNNSPHAKVTSVRQILAQKVDDFLEWGILFTMRARALQSSTF